jgi:D-lactate dehydrogenase
MKVAMFDTHHYDRASFEAAPEYAAHQLQFFEPRLTQQTAALANGFEGVCSFVNDHVDAATLAALAAGGTRVLALRCAGFNHVDLQAAAAHGITVMRVPEYSPYAVAEHAVALVLSLNRKIHRAPARVREWNFSLEGLVGWDLHGKTVGIVGTGRIGQVAARCFSGFGCRVLAFDVNPDPTLAASGIASYVPLSELYAESDVISLHVPLTPETHHLVDKAAMAQMKPASP